MVERTNETRKQTIETLDKVAQTLSNLFDSEIGMHIPLKLGEQYGAYYCHPERPILKPKEGQKVSSAAYREEKAAWEKTEEYAAAFEVLINNEANNKGPVIYFESKQFEAAEPSLWGQDTNKPIWYTVTKATVLDMSITKFKRHRD